MLKALHLSHIVVKDGLLLTIVPLDRYSGPVLVGDHALVTFVSAPINAVADRESSGLFTGHLIFQPFPRGTLPLRQNPGKARRLSQLSKIETSKVVFPREAIRRPDRRIGMTYPPSTSPRRRWRLPKGQDLQRRLVTVRIIAPEGRLL